jgi:hypothetical protein
MVLLGISLLGRSFGWAAKYEVKGECDEGENEHVFSHGHYWKSWGRHRAASAEAR